MEARPYYEAYDDRYRQVHQQNLEWFSRNPSPIVGQVLEEFHLGPDSSILELGCGEGRDAIHLLRQGYRVLATDISPEAIAHCRRIAPTFSNHFQVLDCIDGKLDGQFDFIYAVAVVHMLVEDIHRKGFYQFIHSHLKECGIALICTMGDGEIQRKSDITNAFSLQERIHEQSGKTVHIASTSCRMVDFPTFRAELKENGLAIAQEGQTAIEPDFTQMMYAVVRRQP
ncbi:MAG: class I SAM-dependent methyltransferase [Clostridiales bacterium]|nr:class I SAM-dependent methyltransferase [Clostridiales bacterium]